MPRLKILLVDDDEDFLAIAAEFLERNGYDVSVTSDLEEARRLLEHDSFAVAFLDINFENSDYHDKRGLTLAIDTIGTSAVPKVILTVHDEFDFARESLIPRSGKGGAAIDFLNKGNGLPQLVETIEKTVRRVKVFFSYSSTDVDVVRDLYTRLQIAGLLPWMDKMDIKPGEEWEDTVRKAIREADFAVVFVSKAGVDRTGHYQKEIKLILQVQGEQPPGRIFAVPARLDDCEILHEELNALHRVDLFDPGGYKQLLAMLNNPNNP